LEYQMAEVVRQPPTHLPRVLLQEKLLLGILV
jgi:hypothetical protein